MKSIFKFLMFASLLWAFSMTMNAMPVQGGSDDRPAVSTQAVHAISNQAALLTPDINQPASIAPNRLIKTGIKNLALHGHHSTYAFSNDNDDKIIAVLLAIIFPPLGVAIWEDGITSHFWLSLILTLIFWFPGLIYSLLIILN